MIYLTRASLPLTSSRGWSRYIDIQRLVNIFSDRNSSTGCFVTLRFPFFFFYYWSRYVPEIGVPFIEGKIKDIVCKDEGENFALIHRTDRDPQICSPWMKKMLEKKIDSNSLHDLLTQFLICNSYDRSN